MASPTMWATRRSTQAFEWTAVDAAQWSESVSTISEHLSASKYPTVPAAVMTIARELIKSTPAETVSSESETLLQSSMQTCVMCAAATLMAQEWQFRIVSTVASSPSTTRSPRECWFSIVVSHPTVLWSGRFPESIAIETLSVALRVPIDIVANLTGW
eukprot:Amastigsp_a841961_21.p3 type:complete len:158 gc:universal Amastigsp_a841961_21:647-174(-)